MKKMKKLDRIANHLVSGNAITERSAAKLFGIEKITNKDYKIALDKRLKEKSLRLFGAMQGQRLVMFAAKKTDRLTYDAKTHTIHLEVPTGIGGYESCYRIKIPQ